MRKTSNFGLAAAAAALLWSCGGSSGTLTQEFNFAPVIINDQKAYEAMENQVSAFTVNATDPDFDQLTLTISGTDADAFVNAGRGVVEFVEAPDFETPLDANVDNIYELTITVSDGIESDVENFTVEVTNDPSDDPITFASCEGYNDLNGNPVADYYECTVSKDNSGRTFVVYEPPAYANQTEAVPLLFSLHGYTSLADFNLLYTGFQEYADQEGFIVVYPRGEVLETTGQTHWNVGGWTVGSSANDIEFIGVIADYLGAAYNINTDRVYSTGMSNGGFMSYLLACQDSGRFAAVGSVTGSMTPETYDACAPTRPVPTMQIHGTADPTVPVGGSAVGRPIAEVVDYWATANNCDKPATQNIVADTPADSNTTGGVHDVYSNCDGGVGVEYYLLDDVQHRWPTRTRYDIHAAGKLWEFFSKYDLNGPIP